MKELIPLLEQLAQKLGTTTEYLMRVLTKQAFYSGLVDIFQYIIIIVGIVMWWKFKDKAHKSGEDSYIATWLFGGAILAILTIVSFFCINTTVAAFVNPDYWALDKLMSMIKGLK